MSTLLAQQGYAAFSLWARCFPRMGIIAVRQLPKCFKRRNIPIPCHRTEGSDHSLTGYAGGLEAKRGYIYKKIRLSERREKFACIKLLQYQYKNRNFALQREKQRTQTERFLIIS